MRILFCWRCQMDIPMLDEDEFAAVTSAHGAGGIQEGYITPKLDEYERLTGFKETNLNAIYHHQISLYGEPCTHCGKPMRTAKALFCAACGVPKSHVSQDGSPQQNTP